MRLSQLQSIVEAQREALDARQPGLEREVLASLPDIRTHALVISGIRRGGKSTLLHQFVLKRERPFFHLNFDDIRLATFDEADYGLLDSAIHDSGSKLLFFDEIQNAPAWERYVRQKLDEGFQILVTGSNASLLSREFGSALTGRHLQRELFPFSFSEFLRFTERSADKESLETYLRRGGFPEYLRNGIPETVEQLQQDILSRDIAVRFNIRDDRSLRRLYLWLLSNAGNLVSPSKLTGVIGSRSPTTVLEYLSHLESAWMLHSVPRFAWSAKAQALAPRKIYAEDLAFIELSSLSSSDDMGRRLENLVFLELRRNTHRVFYFSQNDRECDFVVNPSRDGAICIQVCWDLNADTQDREFAGLREAMDFFAADTGYILTANQEDQAVVDGRTVSILPAWHFDRLGRLLA
jgi:predicted AAA+ superfamily ATPase